MHATDLKRGNPRDSGSREGRRAIGNRVTDIDDAAVSLAVWREQHDDRHAHDPLGRGHLSIGHQGVKNIPMVEK
jgi:hypothetical protein